MFCCTQKIIPIIPLSILLSACSVSDFEPGNLSLDCSSEYTRCSPGLGPRKVDGLVVQLVDSQSGVTAIDEIPVVIPDIEPLLFGFDQWQLLRQEDLSKAIDFLLLNRHSGVTLHGYADQFGSQDYNRKLSKLRSQSVESLLLEAGVLRNQIHIVGHGETSPKVPEISAMGELTKTEIIAYYAPNRRVELEFDLSSFIVQSN
ncbi:OmpA family protein [Marinomonas balearica]|uniref:Outer membrane protein OmpA-like peptidoglycan-associated protein n=1 Tax=Marinomonas balearica TaxID=491947 RepID=A0A4R6M423_9GAMM|nr:OmpA family protein [Marinomonas balearica]TDO96023.1 outer membrane protein OmpA-like peptidoglycan-associated protein [Marinomonas balearica]